jgi:riboflavin kinase, archaea type
MPNKIIKIQGILTSGLGTGKFFIEKEDYQKSFKKSLSYIPWPGTFNLKLNSPLPKKIEYSTINGFKEKNKTFGSIKYHKCSIINKKVKNLITHLIIPQKTEHDKITIEIISPKHLRKFLNVKDGDEITISIEE